MAQRERYTVAIRCDCGSEGRVEYEENVNPAHHHGDLNREFISLEGQFRAGVGRDPAIYCRTCGRKVP